jgi:hypothetical protein
MHLEFGESKCVFCACVKLLYAIYCSLLIEEIKKYYMYLGLFIGSMWDHWDQRSTELCNQASCQHRLDLCPFLHLVSLSLRISVGVQGFYTVK